MISLLFKLPYKLQPYAYNKLIEIKETFWKLIDLPCPDEADGFRRNIDGQFLLPLILNPFSLLDSPLASCNEANETETNELQSESFWDNSNSVLR